ncbi:MAG: hypothetical protein N3B18_11215 [Desulfobacterota bacterium]|nr:hypothetical protein [Thermodesulfobacteriota bacterium]
MRLAIFSGNNVSPTPDIVGEHGFSVLIERAHDGFLFDTGQEGTAYSIMHFA